MNVILNIQYIIDDRRDCMKYIAAESQSPIEKGDFLTFTKKEAETYFNWYVEHIDERIEYLMEYIRSQGESIKLDFSVNSLVEIWNWYVKQIKVERYTQDELEEMAKEYPEWIREEIMSDDRKLSYETLAICGDVAIYFAEVIRRHNENDISWGFFTRPKNMYSVNEPVLLGFIGNQNLNPRGTVYHCTLHYIDDEKRFNLYEMYRVWEEDIPKKNMDT